MRATTPLLTKRYQCLVLLKPMSPTSLFRSNAISSPTPKLKRLILKSTLIHLKLLFLLALILSARLQVLTILAPASATTIMS